MALEKQSASSTNEAKYTFLKKLYFYEEIKFVKRKQKRRKRKKTDIAGKVI